jgi:hypothetical protein
VGARKFGIGKEDRGDHQIVHEAVPRLPRRDAKERWLQPHEVHAVQNRMVSSLPLGWLQRRRLSFACRCWLCACAIVPGGSYPSHYANWNVFGCRGAQFNDTQRETTIASKIGFALLSPFVLAVAIVLFAIWCGVQLIQTQSSQLILLFALLSVFSFFRCRLPFLPLWITMYACSERMRGMTFTAMFTKTLQIEVRLIV